MPDPNVHLPDDYVEVIEQIGPTGERGLLTLQLLLAKAGYELPEQDVVEQEIGP